MGRDLAPGAMPAARDERRLAPGSGAQRLAAAGNSGLSESVLHGGLATSSRLPPDQQSDSTVQA
jgi:hypothetical protein